MDALLAELGYLGRGDGDISALSRSCQAKLIKFSAVFLKTPPTFSVNVLASLGKRRKILVFDEECMLRRQ